MVGRDEDIVAVQAVDDPGHNASKLGYRVAHSGKGLFFVAGVSRLVDLIVVDVDDPVRLDELTAISLVHRHEVIGFYGCTIYLSENLLPVGESAGWHIVHQNSPRIGIAQRPVR